MLDFPVLKLVLDVLWHREHLATSGAENMSKDVRELELEFELEVELDLLDEDELIESSLVTWSMFCCGTGRGLIGDAWAAADCILMKSGEAMFVACRGGRYDSSGCDGSQSG